MNELQNASSFGQYAGQNEEAFLQYAACPFCGAQLQKGASYCIFCMRPLHERRIISAKKRRTSRPVRMLLTMLSVLAALLLALAAFFFLIRPSLLPKASLDLPSPAEFRVLAAGASDEDSVMLWSQDAFVLKSGENGFSCYETQTSLSEEPLRAAFSDDGKCLYIALAEIPDDSAEESADLLKTVFSAVYRYVPENLSEIISEEENFLVKERPGEAFSALLRTFGLSLPGDTEIMESLPIRTDRYPGGPEAHVFRTVSGDRTGYFISFGTETP